jgi:hypothetical protein
MVKVTITCKVEPESSAKILEGEIRDIVNRASENGYEVELLEVTQSEN